MGAIGDPQAGGAPSGTGDNPPSTSATPRNGGASSSPLDDRELTFARYDSAQDKIAKPETKLWSQWATELTTHTIRPSKDGPCVVLGSIAAGQSHKNELVNFTDAIGLDLEGAKKGVGCSEAELERALLALKDWAFVLYSTHKNGSSAAHADPDRRVRARVVLPWARSVQPEEHDDLWSALNALTGAVSDPTGRNIARLFYLPSAPNPDHVVAHINSGRLLDPSEMRAILKDQAGTASIAGESPDAGTLAESKTRVRRWLRRVHTSETTDSGRMLKPIANAILAGAAFAESGERHNALLAITIWLAQKLEKKPVPLDAILEVFAPSLLVMQNDDASSPGMGELQTAWEGAVAKVKSWRDAHVEAEQAERLADAEKKQLAAVGAEGKYSDDEMRQIAHAAKVPCDGIAPVIALQRRWIIQAGDAAFYLLAHDGGYRGPYGVTTARTAAVEILARAHVRLNEDTRNGTRRRTISELAEDYGMVATDLVADMTIEKTWLDEKTRRVYEAVRPLRNIASEYNPEIDQWLRLLGGPLYDKLLDWMACAPDLKKLLCAIYFAGHPGAGKTLFAQGMSRLWADTPAEIDKVLSDFNDEVARCPLALADETLPKTWKGTSITAKLRSLLSTQERAFSRKYLPNCTLRGAIRLVITANNDFLLATKDAVSGQDVEAIAQRFIHVTPGEDATKYLETLPISTRTMWLEGGIARHARYLQDTRVVTPGRRFWVEGEPSRMHLLLIVSAEWTARVVEILARFLQDPANYYKRNDGLIRVEGGRLLVNEQGIVNAWSMYFPNTKLEPDMAKIGTALRAVSGKDRPQLHWPAYASGGRKRYRYRDIKTDIVLAWANEQGMDVATMRRTLLGVAPDEREPGEDDVLDDEQATNDDYAPEQGAF